MRVVNCGRPTESRPALAAAFDARGHQVLAATMTFTNGFGAVWAGGPGVDVIAAGASVLLPPSAFIVPGGL